MHLDKLGSHTHHPGQMGGCAISAAMTCDLISHSSPHPPMTDTSHKSTEHTRCIANLARFQQNYTSGNVNCSYPEPSYDSTTNTNSGDDGLTYI